MVMHRPSQFARFQIGAGSLHLVQLPSAARFHIEKDNRNLDLSREADVGGMILADNRQRWRRSQQK
jgi:hypothetical protein